jgi:hypothetical protein|tara:strand:+ start:1385 stop:1852 length:468 start_codon:yes stop_codon:yes gene_type:complete
MDEAQLKDLIERVLNKIELYSPEASDLVFKTLKVESLLKYVRQIKGIAVGFGQCEPWVAVDICKNYLKYRPDLMKQVADTINVKLSYFTLPKEEDWAWILETNIAAMISFCRLHYRRIPKALPKKNLDEQWIYYKKYYNTERGKATNDHWMEILS